MIGIEGDIMEEYNQGQYQEPIRGFNNQGQGFNNQGQPQGFNYQDNYNDSPMQGFNPQHQPYENNMFYPPVEKNPTLTRDIILSLLQGVLMGMWITAIISFIFTLIANDKFVSHMYADYEKHTKYARISRIVGCVIFGIIVLLFIIFYSMIAITFMTMG